MAKAADEANTGQSGDRKRKREVGEASKQNSTRTKATSEVVYIMGIVVYFPACNSRG